MSKEYNNLGAIIAKKLYRKMQDTLILNQTKSKLIHSKDGPSFENINSDFLRKERNGGKLQNLTDRNKDSLMAISTNKLNEVNDFFHKITKNSSSSNLNKEKLRQKQVLLKKEIKRYSNYPSFNSSNSYSSQRFLNTPISLNTKNI